MKYIFLAGAPGSKWSSVAKNVYYSDSIDRSDYSQERRTYYHDASGHLELMHLGAYWDPGMEFGQNFDRLGNMTREQCEEEFDRPFSGQGVRIIKSHVFCHHLDFLKENWPDSPIIAVHRANDACLGWWVRCGHFNITYPSYSIYYQNLREMARIIDHQNRDLSAWMQANPVEQATDNRDLCRLLGIVPPPPEYQQYYGASDITVKVLR